MKTDLHLHTTASDGSRTPTEIIKWGKSNGLELMAITDHDTVGGLKEGMAAAKQEGIKFVPGLEISSYSICEIHVLGYNIDFENKEFIERLNEVQNQRKERNIRIGEKLKELGINLDFDFAGDGVGRMNMAREIVKEGYCSDVAEVFDKYLGVYGKAYCTAKRMTPIDAVKLIKDFGGFASLAHPKKYLLDKRLEILVSGLKSYGLDGIEVNYPGHSEQDIKLLNAMCQKYRLLPTGGSDFHGDEDRHFAYDIDPRTQKRLLKH